ncbi:hypothetical protein D3C78_1749030 [compost metagenome]
MPAPKNASLQRSKWIGSMLRSIRFARISPKAQRAMPCRRQTVPLNCGCASRKCAVNCRGYCSR